MVVVGDFLTYVALGWLYKTAVEVVMQPVTCRVIAFIKRREPTYRAAVSAFAKAPLAELIKIRPHKLLDGSFFSMTVTTDVMVIGTVRDYGDQALLLQFDSTAEVLAWVDALREEDLLGVAGIVPASRTVLIKLHGPRYRAVTRQRLGKLHPAPEAVEETLGTAPIDGRADVVIDVVYDGADLDAVARLTGLDPAQVVAAHTDTPWRVGFGGFAPGFAYLVGGDPRLKVPRRSEPRTKVPAGSVALAGEFSAVYPRQSPGGWQLIVLTDAVLWDVERDHPALLTPGMWSVPRSSTNTGLEGARP